VTFLDVTVEDFDYMVGLNLRATFFVAQTVARRMIESSKRGSIINISSDMGLVGGPNRTVYCSTKHGMEGMAKAMAIDLGPHGVRVNTICPTFIETPLARGFLVNEAVRSWVLSRIKLGRIGQVEDLMGAVVFLSFRRIFLDDWLGYGCQWGLGGRLIQSVPCRLHLRQSHLCSTGSRSGSVLDLRHASFSLTTSPACRPWSAHRRYSLHAWLWRCSSEHGFTRGRRPYRLL
jgi:hypothetical protein